MNCIIHVFVEVMIDIVYVFGNKKGGLMLP